MLTLVLWAQQAPSPEVTQWVQSIVFGPVGAGMLLVAALYGLLKKDPWLVPGHQFRDMVIERDRYRDINQRMIDALIRGGHVTLSAVELAKKTVVGNEP
jgi:hypothetical protein